MSAVKIILIFNKNANTTMSAYAVPHSVCLSVCMRSCYFYLFYFWCLFFAQTVCTELCKKKKKI